MTHEWLIRFEHADKRLAVNEFPGTLSEAAEAALYETDVATLRSVRAALRPEPVELDPSSWSLRAGDVVVALGDSITDDLLSWAEILRAPLERGGIAVVNAGLSGDTTADALRRLHGVVALKPALVITMLGTNDAQRHGGCKPLLSTAESVANLTAIRTWLRAAGARTAWITPPPVDEAALAASVAPRPFAIRAGDVRAIADAVCAFPDPVVDSWTVLDGGLEADGVHPSPEGQRRLAVAVTKLLSAAQ